MAQSAIEAFNVIGQARALDSRDMALLRDDVFIRRIMIRVKGGLFPIGRRYFIPQLPSAVLASVADVESDDLAGLDIQGDPDPLLVVLIADKAPQLVNLGGQHEQGHLRRTAHRLKVNTQVGGQCVVKLGDQGQQPSQANIENPANPPQGVALQQGFFNQRSGGFGHGFGRGFRDELASARLATVVLFAGVDMTVLLMVARAATGTNFSFHGDTSRI